MTQESFEQLQLWTKAIGEGLATVDQWHDWALREVARSPRPESWICELAQTPTPTAALACLAAVRVDSSLRRLDARMLDLGVLYARYLHGTLTMVELLRRAGDGADRRNDDDPPCETYYALLTRAERASQPAAEIEVEVRRLFAPAYKDAQRALAGIGVVL